MQYPQPLQMSCCTTTVPDSVRKSEPVGHTSRHAAEVQCLHTSEDMSQRSPPSGTSFHSLQATSHALQPMQTDVSVKKPTRSVVTGAPPWRAAPTRPPR